MLALGLPSFAYASGHAAQLLVPLLWLNAYLDARRGRGTRAAVLVGASAGLETWGLLGLPLLLALAPRAALRAATAAVAVAAALYLPFVLGGDFRMAEYRWTVADGTPVSLLVHGEFPWGLRLAQGVLAVAVGAVILLAPGGRSPAASRPRGPSWPSGSCSTRSGTAGTGSRRSSWRSRSGVALAGAGLVVAREAVVRQRLPRRRVGDVLVPLRPDPRILVERAEPDADRRPVVGARPREQA